MSTAFPVSPLSPSVGVRRKGLQALPRLPLSAFSPPNTGSSDRFPLPPSPSTVQPDQIIDAHVVAPDADLSRWKEEVGEEFGGRIKGVVLSLHDKEPAEVEKILQQCVVSTGTFDVPILAIVAPFSLDVETPTLPSYLKGTTSSKPLIVGSATFTKSSASAKATLASALEEGLTVNIDVQSHVRESEGGWESLEELLTSVNVAEPAESKGNKLPGKIVLSNIVPPPDDLSLTIVKLLTHASYRNYQSHTASLSLFSNVFVNFLPPSWDAPTPSSSEESLKQRNEWKRRIKMYLGPVVEAFGYQRILFGSSPSPSSKGTSNAADWFELARESFAELGFEQDAIEAVFYDNAKLVYGS
ncbi:hypothetical protein B0H21DRAFT_837253 [Amylocystis lapponica]|nr:hypothetical protein B0H21DRAFT_837253 [Amylocystis lapponica]